VSIRIYGATFHRLRLHLRQYPRKAAYHYRNTCGFIDAAKEESYKMLAELVANKKKGQVLIAAGCLTQRYGVEVARRVPGIDGIIGTRRWMYILKVVDSLNQSYEPNYHLPKHPQSGVTNMACNVFQCRRQRLYQDRRWLSSTVCFLCYPANQRHGCQQTAGNPY